MKKRALLFTIIFLSVTQNIQAQDADSSATDTSDTSSSQDMGAAAADASDTGSSNNWQNWVFASTALVSAAIGVLVVALNPGSTSH